MEERKISAGLGPLDPGLYVESGFSPEDAAEIVERLMVGAPAPKALVVGAGVGAWSFGYYKLGLKADGDPRKKAGILAVKQAIIDAGYPQGIDLSMFVFGNAVTNRVKEYQAAQQLTADGIVGPTTARYLWRQYAGPVETELGIPNRWISRLGTGESNADPVAEGVVDPQDEGYLQFHLPYWPGTTLEQAWSPKYEIGQAGEKLKTLRRQTTSWKGAIAAWNVGSTYARQWVDAGYPSSGGPSMGTDANGNTIDSFTRATHYYDYVSALPF